VWVFGSLLTTILQTLQRARVLGKDIRAANEVSYRLILYDRRYNNSPVQDLTSIGIATLSRWQFAKAYRSFQTCSAMSWAMFKTRTRLMYIPEILSRKKNGMLYHLILNPRFQPRVAPQLAQYLRRYHRHLTSWTIEYLSLA
jgi:hypothetical protein